MSDETTAAATVVFGEIETTEHLAEMAKALATAQGEMAAASKDRNNPHFNYSYATLASVWEACRAPLAKNGLAVVQQPVSNNGRIGVVTTLLHASGQWMRSTLWVTPKDQGAQALGSALTYGRRYSLAAFVGVAPDDDDDGHGATVGSDGNGKSHSKPPRAPAQTSHPATQPPRGETDSFPEGAPPTGDKADGEQKNRILQHFKKLGWPAPHQRSWLQKHAGVQGVSDLTAAAAVEIERLLTNHETQAA